MTKKTLDGRLLGEIVVVDSDGDELPIDKSDVTGFKGLRVVIDPLDDLYQEKSFRTVNEIAIGKDTVKYSIIVPAKISNEVLTNMKVSLIAYNGATKLYLYEGITFTDGVVVPIYNKNRNAVNIARTTIKTGVVSTGGTLLSAIYAGAGTKSTAVAETANWLLKFGENYRLDVIGLANGSIAIVTFDLYEG